MSMKLYGNYMEIGMKLYGNCMKLYGNWYELSMKCWYLYMLN